MLILYLLVYLKNEIERTPATAFFAVLLPSFHAHLICCVSAFSLPQLVWKFKLTKSLLEDRMELYEAVVI
ncbi:MAG: hypothetical protein DRI01_10495 [Chloroflexi bacterium]|nr:MAG: hypothetical protein DRI01_10495 [Chloroflexota bacterium]